MERTLSLVTLGLYQCIIAVTPVMVIPMLLITVISPIVMFKEHPENRMIFFSQFVFLIGCFLPQKRYRIPTKVLGFFGMIIALISLIQSGDTGGEIGAKSYQGMALTAATGIPFIVVGITALSISIFKKEGSNKA